MSATLADGARIAVTGGRPSAAELAAVTAALDAACLAEAAAPARRPGWLAAARLEALGGRLVASPADLAQGASATRRR